MLLRMRAECAAALRADGEELEFDCELRRAFDLPSF